MSQLICLKTILPRDGFVWDFTITGRSKWDFRAQAAIRNVIVAFKRRHVEELLIDLFDRASQIATTAEDWKHDPMTLAILLERLQPQQHWTASLKERIFISLFRGIRNARAQFHAKTGTTAALTAGTGPQNKLLAAVDRFELAGSELRPDVTEELLQLAGGRAEDDDDDVATAATASCRAEHEDTGLGKYADEAKSPPYWPTNDENRDSPWMPPPLALNDPDAQEDRGTSQAQHPVRAVRDALGEHPIRSNPLSPTVRAGLAQSEKTIKAGMRPRKREA